MDTDPIKINQATCIICGESSSFSEKNGLYTELLIDQLVPPSQKKSFRNLKLFDFCNSCIEILGELQQLDVGLKFILNNIRQKKTEIQLKILKAQYKTKATNTNEEFRKVTTQGFCPRVQMFKNNELHRCDSISTRNIDVTNMGQCHCKRRLPLLTENSTTEKEITELQNSDKKKNSLSTSTKRSRKTHYSHNEDSSSDPQRSSFHSSNGSKIYFDGKIQSESEIISIESPHGLLPFHEEETVVKFEPWHEQYHNFDDVNGDKMQNGHDVISSIEKNFEVNDLCEDNENIARNKLMFSKDDQDRFAHHGRIWTKPPLSYVELTVLAIMTSENMLIQVTQLYDFISSNFPYYEQEYGNNFPKVSLRHGISRCSYITKYRNDDHGRSSIIYAYGLKKSYDCLNTSRIKLCHKLMQENFSSCMAYPERRQHFWKALNREIVDPSTSNSIMGDSKLISELTTINIEDSNSIPNENHFDINMDLNETPSNEAIFPPFSNNSQYSFLRNEIQQKSSQDDINISSMLFQSLSNDDGPLLQATNNTADSSCFTIFRKPLLSYDDMCILAIMNSNSMIVSVPDAYAFIKENFPFYAVEMKPSCKFVIKTVLSQSKFTAYRKTTIDEKLVDTYMWYLYTIREDQLPPNERERIATILNSPENIASMAFPERFYDFVENIVRKKLAPNLSLYDSSKERDGDDLTERSVSVTDRREEKEYPKTLADLLCPTASVADNYSASHFASDKLYDYLYNTHLSPA